MKYTDHTMAYVEYANGRIIAASMLSDYELAQVEMPA